MTENIWQWGGNQYDQLKARLQRVEDIAPRQIVSKNFATSLGGYRALSTEAINSDGLIDPTSGISTIGSVPPTVNNAGFAFTATVNSQTAYWDGTNGSSLLKISRANSTYQVVPAGSITASGLSASMWYGYLPYWTPANACGIGWVLSPSGSIAWPGGTGASFVNAATAAQIADGLALQVLAGREPLTSGFMTFQCPAGGSTSGGGGGGGGIGFCVMSGTDVEPIGSGRLWKDIYPETNWVHLKTEDLLNLNCTYDHPLYREDALGGLAAAVQGKTIDQYTEELLAPFRVNAEVLQVGDKVLTNFGVRALTEAYKFNRNCTKHSVHMDSGHLYLANGYISHNVKASTE